MAETNTYYWKELLSLNKEYIKASSGISSAIDIKDCDLSSILLFFDEDLLNSNFIEEYQFFTISTSAKNLIDILLENHQIYDVNSSFYLLSAIFQKEYINYYELLPNMAKPLHKDFQNERKDLGTLLDILYLKLSQGNNVVKSVSIKTKKTITINNFFVVNDVLDALIKYYDLNLKNFEKRKQKLIEDTNSVKLELFDEYQKWLFIKGLYNYISKNKDSTSKTLNEHIRFVGSFILISQIPINKTHFEVPILNDIKTIISIEEIKYLNGFLNRPKAFFV